MIRAKIKVSNFFLFQGSVIHPEIVNQPVEAGLVGSTAGAIPEDQVFRVLDINAAGRTQFLYKFSIDVQAHLICIPGEGHVLPAGGFLNGMYQGQVAFGRLEQDCVEGLPGGNIPEVKRIFGKAIHIAFGKQVLRAIFADRLKVHTHRKILRIEFVVDRPQKLDLIVASAQKKRIIAHPTRAQRRRPYRNAIVGRIPCGIVQRIIERKMSNQSDIGLGRRCKSATQQQQSKTPARSGGRNEILEHSFLLN